QIRSPHPRVQRSPVLAGLECANRASAFVDMTPLLGVVAWGKPAEVEKAPWLIELPLRTQGCSPSGGAGGHRGAAGACRRSAGETSTPCPWSASRKWTSRECLLCNAYCVTKKVRSSSRARGDYRCGHFTCSLCMAQPSQLLALESQKQ